MPVECSLRRNALKFVAADGTGAVRLEAAFDQETSLLTLRVVDNGRGMTPEGMGRIFRPFQQAEGNGALFLRSREGPSERNFDTACLHHSLTRMQQLNVGAHLPRRRPCCVRAAESDH